MTVSFYDAWTSGTIRPANGWACWECGEQWLTRGAMSIPAGTGVDGSCRHPVLHATYIRVTA